MEVVHEAEAVVVGIIHRIPWVKASRAVTCSLAARMILLCDSFWRLLKVTKGLS